MRSRSPPKADLSEARRGAGASNIPKTARIRANGTNEAEPNGSVRVQGPSTEAKRSAAKERSGYVQLCAVPCRSEVHLSGIKHDEATRNGQLERFGRPCLACHSYLHQTGRCGPAVRLS